jgi:hypothetical protein
MPLVVFLGTFYFQALSEIPLLAISGTFDDATNFFCRHFLKMPRNLLASTFPKMPQKKFASTFSEMPPITFPDF